MIQDDVMTIVTNIFREELQRDNLELTPATEIDQTDGWDSVTGSCIVIAIEHHFDFEFDGNILERLTTVGELVDMIRLKQVAMTTGI